MKVLTTLLFLFLAATLAAATDWPGMGGPLGNHSVVDPELSMDWSGARVAWRFQLTGNTDRRNDIGIASSELAIRDGRVFLVDRDAESRHAILRVLDLAAGEELWTFRWQVSALPPAERSEVEKRQLASRENRPFAGPAVGEKLVFLSGPLNATFRAVDRETHDEVWAADLPQHGLWSSGSTKPQVFDDLVLLIAHTAHEVKKKQGGPKDLLIAFDQATGALRWRCDLPTRKGFGGRVQNAPVVVTLHGVRQIVVHHQNGVAGVSPSGKLLWNWGAYKKGNVTATPSVSPDGFIFVQSGHGGTRALGHVTLVDGAWETATIFCDEKETAGNWSAQGNKHTTGAAWWDGAFYMGTNKGLQCMLPDGSVPWCDHCSLTDAKGRKTRGTNVAPLAPVTIVNGRLLTLSAPGDLIIAAADQKEYREFGRVPMGAPSVMLPAYSAGRVVVISVRTGQVVCVDLVGND